MSSRGAYGFVLNSERTVTYCRQGSGFYGLGTAMLHLLKKDTLAELIHKVSSLEPMNPDHVLTGDEVQKFQMSVDTRDANTSGTKDAYFIDGKIWKDILEPFQYDLEGLLNTGKYISGEWSIKDSIEHLYLADIDKQLFEIWIY